MPIIWGCGSADANRRRCSARFFSAWVVLFPTFFLKRPWTFSVTVEMYSTVNKGSRSGSEVHSHTHFDIFSEAQKSHFVKTAGDSKRLHSSFHECSCWQKKITDNLRSVNIRVLSIRLGPKPSPLQHNGVRHFLRKQIPS